MRSRATHEPARTVLAALPLLHLHLREEGGVLMRQVPLALTLVALIATSARAEPESWTRADTAFQTTFLVTLALDYAQTKQITDDGREWNPAMGARGERLPPEIYFVGVAIVHTFVMRALPQPYRRIAQCVSVGVQVGNVARNAYFGYTVVF